MLPPPDRPSRTARNPRPPLTTTTSASTASTSRSNSSTSASAGAQSILTLSGWGSGGSGGPDLDRGKYIETDISMGRNEGNGSEDEGQYDGYDSVEGEDVRMEGPSRIPMTARGERVGPDGFGHVISVQRGTMAGRMMRFSLTMEQQPIHGRRKTEKDRRPLAHCPILRLKLREVKEVLDGHGSSMVEEDIEIADIEPGDFICAAELFETKPGAVPIITDHTHDPSPPDTSRRASLPGQPRRRTPPGGRDVSMGEPPPLPIPNHLRRSGSPPGSGLGRSITWTADHVASVPGESQAVRYPDEYGESINLPSRDARDDGGDSSRDTTSTPSSATATPAAPSVSAQRSTYPPPPPAPLVNAVGASRSNADTHREPVATLPSRPPAQALVGTPRTAGERSSGSSGSGESITGKPSSKKSKQTVQRNLFGSLHVPGVRVIAPEGDFGLWFLFTDLSVRQEGTFALRFRVFDITAADRQSGSSSPVLVETGSQAFKVYSPRNFPGLPKPTELAEHFGRQGFKLNTRKNERQAKTPPPTSDPAPAANPKGRPGRPPLSTKPPSPTRPEARPLQSHTSPVSPTHGYRSHSSSTASSSILRHTSSDERSTLSREKDETSGGFSSKTELSGESSATIASSISSGMSSGRGRGVAPSPLSKSFDDPSL